MPSSRLAIKGSVDFGPKKKIQATATEIAVAATVSLLDTTTNSTVAATTTDAAGKFILSLPSFTPVEARIYILEAVKGLFNNLVGADAARLRTYIRINNGLWTSISAGGVLLNRSTTAIAIVAGLKRGSATPVNEASLIGSLTIGVPGGSAQPPDTFTGTTNLSATEFTTVWGLVDKALGQDIDPIGAISTQGSGGGGSTAYSLTTTLGPVVTSLDPTSGAPGAVVVLTGARFAADVASNSVSFNGASGQIITATSTQIKVTVPFGATSGFVTVQNASGVSNGMAFLILPSISGNVKGP